MSYRLRSLWARIDNSILRTMFLRIRKGSLKIILRQIRSLKRLDIFKVRNTSMSH